MKILEAFVSNECKNFYNSWKIFNFYYWKKNIHLINIIKIIFIFN